MATRRLLAHVVELEAQRPHLSVWTPRLTHWRPFRRQVDTERAEEESPDEIEGLRRMTPSLARDADVLPSPGFIHTLGRRLHALRHRCMKADVLFSIKIAVVVALYSQIAFYPTTVHLFQTERGIWTITVGPSLLPAC